MTADRRTGTFCAVHLIPFLDCPCEDRRDTTRGVQLVVCDGCGKHFTECRCPEPQLAARGAA